jgi:high-affinity nickel-transport protein
MAGSAAVALLVLATIRDVRWAIFYLLTFGAGTIVGMMLITAAIATPFVYGNDGSGRLGRRLRLASGVLSVGFGLLIAWRIGSAHGLFVGTPTGSPE